MEPHWTRSNCSRRVRSEPVTRNFLSVTVVSHAHSRVSTHATHPLNHVLSVLYLRRRRTLPKRSRHLQRHRHRRGHAGRHRGPRAPTKGGSDSFRTFYYDPDHQWWALSDRGPGGGTLSYETRLQRIALNVHPVTGRISQFRVMETIKFTDPDGLLDPGSGRVSLDGLNPFGLTGNAGFLSTSFDPEGLVVDPRTRHFLVADEYGPSLYEFDRQGRLVHVFETPAKPRAESGSRRELRCRPRSPAQLRCCLRSAARQQGVRTIGATKGLPSPLTARNCTLCSRIRS